MQFLHDCLWRGVVCRPASGPRFRLVVSVELLDCFDYLIWLRSGAAAAERLGFTQSSISRHAKSVSQCFGVTTNKADGEWEVVGDATLLNLERQVHQFFRWSSDLPLRIEAQYYSGPLFCDPVPPGCHAGNFDFLEVHTPFGHLRTGVIDAWIACYPDVPDPEDEEFASFHLTRLPTNLVVAEGHPLIELGDAVTLDHVKEYPSLALRDNAFPKVQSILQNLGLWNLPLNQKRYLPEKWVGRVEDLTVGYATSFSIGLFERPRVILPIQIHLEVGDTLIVRRKFADHPRLLELLEFFQSKALNLFNRFSDVRIP